MNRFQKMTVAGREVIVCLPSSYHKSDASYPVVYVHDGGELFQHSFNLLEHMTILQELPELILIGIETDNRNAEYTPWPKPSLVASYPPFQGQGQAYVDEVADVLKPYIDKHFRTRREAEHTVMAGGSFGGLISLFAAYWRPETFGKYALLSTSFWYEGALEYIEEHGAPNEHLRLYMSVGSCEGIHKTNIQKNMVESTIKAHASLLAHGFPQEQLRFVLEEGGTHDAVFMGRRFPEALHWLFAKEGL